MRQGMDKRFGGYCDPLEIALEQIEGLLSRDYGISKEAIALLLMQDDSEINDLVKKREPEAFEKISGLIIKTKESYNQPLSYIINLRRQEEANRIVSRAVTLPEKQRPRFLEKLGLILMNPFFGGPILLFVLYFGLYEFVGKFGAGVLVNFLENVVFGKFINPFMIKLFDRILPWRVIHELFAGEYGIFTLGIRYAVAIIFPIVATFFIAFSIIEDTGYLPRLALLIDRLFKKIGLTGRAVIPMVLGFGCATMATMVTRTLPTKRERVIATLLLALAVPCSAQLGVIFALLEGHPKGLAVWILVLIAVFLFTGFLASRILPGERPTFYMEVPPLRLPQLSNILIKTYTRVKWYFLEIFPMFILASIMIWVGQITRLFDLLVWLLSYPVRLIGLPDKAAVPFLFGFFRRDYGAAGLYDMKKAGLLNGAQLVVATVTLTLFLPCIAQFLITIKERGIKTGIAISLFVFLFSFSIGFLVNWMLVSFGISI